MSRPPIDRTLSCLSCLLLAGLVAAPGCRSAAPGSRRTTNDERRTTKDELRRLVVGRWSLVVGRSREPSPRRDRRATGILRAEAPRFRLVVSSLSGIREVAGENGRASLAAGTYTMMRWMAEARDGAGRRWEARGGMWPKPIVVGAGRETEIRLATPLRASLRGFTDMNPMVFRLEFSGPHGELFGGATVDGRQPAPPHLLIRDARGRTIADLPFKYG